MSTAWTRKDLLTIRELDRAEIELILDTGRTFKEVLARKEKKSKSLQGRTVVNLFVEPSTRTRTSFELAASRLDADVISIDSASSSFRKGETLKDTGQVLEAMKADFVILRHSAAGAPQFLAERLKAHIVNAGDGAHEHPTQALLDAFTMRERLGDALDWKNLHVVICGDILFSRVARSNVWALTKLGARVTLVGPTTLVPAIFSELGVTVAHDFDSVLPEADVIMLLRIQHERQQRSFFLPWANTSRCSASAWSDSRSVSRTFSSCTRGRSIAAWRSPAKSPTAQLDRARPGAERARHPHGYFTSPWRFFRVKVTSSTRR